MNSKENTLEAARHAASDLIEPPLIYMPLNNSNNPCNLNLSLDMGVHQEAIIPPSSKSSRLQTSGGVVLIQKQRESLTPRTEMNDMNVHDVERLMVTSAVPAPANGTQPISMNDYNLPLDS